METFNVDKSFILEAHKAACNDWKTKLEKQFPSAFPKKITDRVKSFDDVQTVLGKTENQILPYRNPQTKAEKSQNAFAKIQAITEVLNEGWQPNFDDSSEAKWYPWFEKTSSGWVFYVSSFDCYSSFLGFGCFYKSEALATYAGKQFLDIYKEYLP